MVNRRAETVAAAALAVGLVMSIFAPAAAEISNCANSPSGFDVDVHADSSVALPVTVTVVSGMTVSSISVEGFETFMSEPVAPLLVSLYDDGGTVPDDGTLLETFSFALSFSDSPSHNEATADSGSVTLAPGNYFLVMTSTTPNSNPYSFRVTADGSEVDTDGTLGDDIQVDTGGGWAPSGAVSPILVSILQPGEVACGVTGDALPTTPAPTTAAPSTTAAPTTLAPTTSAPTTVAPTTVAPTTVAPTTVAPTTAAPTTSAPTTQAPTTAGPTTEAPAPDTDMDGLSDDDEDNIHGTSPTDPDSDDDGFPDGLEVSFGYNPLDTWVRPCSDFETCETCAGAALPWGTSIPDLASSCAWCAGVGCVPDDDNAATLCAQVGDSRFAMADNDTTQCGDARPPRALGLSSNFDSDNVQFFPSEYADPSHPFHGVIVGSLGLDLDLNGTFCDRFYPDGGNVCGRAMVDTMQETLNANAGALAMFFGPPGDCCFQAVEELACRVFCDPNNLDWLGLSAVDVAGIVTEEVDLAALSNLNITYYATEDTCQGVLDVCAGHPGSEGISSAEAMCEFLATSVAGNLESDLLNSVTITTGDPRDNAVETITVALPVGPMDSDVMVRWENSDAMIDVIGDPTRNAYARSSPFSFEANTANCTLTEPETTTTAAPGDGGNSNLQTGSASDAEGLFGLSEGGGIGLLIAIIIGGLAILAGLGCMLRVWCGKKPAAATDKDGGAPMTQQSGAATRTRTRTRTETREVNDASSASSSSASTSSSSASSSASS